MKTFAQIAIAGMALVLFTPLAQAKDHRHRSCYSGHSHHSHGGSRISFGLGFIGSPYYYGGPRYYSSYSPSYGYPRTAYVSAVDVQLALARRGYYRGAIDGIIGSMSRQAIRWYQSDYGLPITGRIDSYLVRSLGL